MLRVFENWVLRRIFGPKRDEATWGWSKQHNEELHDLYSSPNIIRLIKSRRMGWEVHVKRERSILGFGGETSGKERPLRRPTSRWEDNINMDLQELRRGAWTGLMWLRMGTGGGHL
jgi:hypothetical protein